MTDPLFKIANMRESFVGRGQSVVLTPQQSAQKRAVDTTCEITVRVTYRPPDYTRHWNIFEGGEARVAEYTLKIVIDVPEGERRRGLHRARAYTVEIVEESPAPRPGSEAFELPIAIDDRTGRVTATLTLTPRERERVFVAFEEKSMVSLRGMLECEVGCRWLAPATKLQEFLEWQYTCTYAPQRQDGSGLAALAMSPDWDVHEKPTEDGTPPASKNVMVSRSGRYAPGAVCVNFANMFLLYWFNYVEKRWYSAGTSAEVVSRFSPVVAQPPGGGSPRSLLEHRGRHSWRRFYADLPRVDAQTRTIFLCYSGGHVWLVMPLGGAFPVKKKYIFGFGQSWEDAGGAPPSWYEDFVELGWYQVHASGPWCGFRHEPRYLTSNREERRRLRRINVVNDNPIFQTRKGNPKEAFVERLIAGYRARKNTKTRPPPSARVEQEGRYSSTETYADLADNLQRRRDAVPDADRYAVFAGTPLPWMNCRLVPIEDEKRPRKGPAVGAVYTLEQDGTEVVHEALEKTFDVYQLADVLDDRGWVDSPPTRNRDVRPLIWTEVPYHGLDPEFRPL